MLPPAWMANVAAGHAVFRAVILLIGAKGVGGGAAWISLAQRWDIEHTTHGRISDSRSCSINCCELVEQLNITAGVDVDVTAAGADNLIQTRDKRTRYGLVAAARGVVARAVFSKKQ